MFGEILDYRYFISGIFINVNTITICYNDEQR